MSETTRMTKAAGIIGSATFISRILGFVRDMIIAWSLGAGPGSDAFFAAFRIPNLLRRLFAEGSLSIAFIPVFTDYLHHKGKPEAFYMARSQLLALAIFLIILVMAGIVAAPLIVSMIAPGFIEWPEKYSLTVELTRIMFPYIFFISLLAVIMGILNCLGHFIAPALAPAILNISIITCALFLSPVMEHPAKGLAVGVLLGGFLQLAFQIPFLLRKGLFSRKNADPFHPGVKKVGKLMLPSIFGSAAYQINIMISTMLASLLGQGSISYLYYADRLVQFPLGIFGIALASAVLPSLARQASVGDLEGLGRTFAHAMNLIAFITIPAMTGLIILREPIIELLFKRGAFDAYTTQMTADALFYYCIGLWAFAGVRILVNAFYAMKDTKTPVVIAVISIAANIVFALFLMKFSGHCGLALAASLSSMINFILLVTALSWRLKNISWASFVKSACKAVLCSAIMGAMVNMMAQRLLTFQSLPLLLIIVICVLAGILFYGVLAFIVKSTEINLLLTLLKENKKES
ncbi:murein biosynthesis integral membrane protein MurJ [Desulfobacterales bacterium HSG16]|nr:murein biosynthesis integral membrane protein MurJ [Desulfobacterales bacterium HSG16]